MTGFLLTTIEWAAIIIIIVFLFGPALRFLYELKDRYEQKDKHYDDDNQTDV